MENQTKLSNEEKKLWVTGFTDFAETHKFKWMPINVKTYTDESGKIKKELTPIRCLGNRRPNMKDFERLSDAQLKEKQDLFFEYPEQFNSVAKDTSSVVEVDVDTPESNSWLKRRKKTIYYKSMTKEYGLHIMMTLKSPVTGKRRGFLECYDTIEKKPGIELLNGQWSFIKMGTTMENADKGIMKYNLKEDHLHGGTTSTVPSKVTMSPKKKKKKKTQSKMKAEELTRFKEYVNLFHENTLSGFQSFLDFTCICCNLGVPMDYWDEVCKRGKNYNKEQNRDKWNEIQVSQANREHCKGWRLIYEWARDANPTAKYALDDKYADAVGFDVLKFAYTQDTDMLTTIQSKKMEIEDLEDMEDEMNKAKYKKKMKALKADLNSLQLEKLAKDYERKKEYWERYVVKIENPVLYVEKKHGEFVVRTSMSMREVYFNARVQVQEGKKIKDKCFFNEWTKDPKMRSYHRMDFCPPPLPVPSHVYNLWEGFVAESFDPEDVEDYPYIKESMKALSNYEPKVVEYLYNYLAHLVQNPGELPRTAIAMQSDQGVGKNLFFENFTFRMLGKKYLLVTTSIDDIVGTFPQTSGKLIVCLDEASAGDTFSNNNKIKGHITTEYEHVQRKGVDAVRMLNCNRMFLFTNENNTFKVEEGDRRFMATRCSAKYKGSTEFFVAVLDEWKNVACVNQFYQDLKNRDISNFDPERDRPTTEFYQELKSVSISNEVRFLDHFIQYGFDEFIEDKKKKEAEDDDWKKATYLYKQYKMHCAEMNWSQPRSDKMFFMALHRELRRGTKTEYKRRGAKGTYLIDRDDIQTWLKKDFKDCL